MRMTGAFYGLIASTLLVSLGVGGDAWAQKARKVVVEQFTGPGGDKIRQDVIKAVGRLPSFEVVSDKKVAATEADLGLLQVSDSYAAVARELKAAAFVSGAVLGGKKPRARIVVKDAEGRDLGQETWTAPTVAKLSATVNRNLGDKIKGLFSSFGGGKAEAVAAKSDEKPTKKEEAPAAAAVAANDEEKPKKKGKRKAEVEEAPAAEASPAVAEESIAESASADEPGPRSPFVRLDLAAGAHIFSRKFKYNQSLKGGLKEYDLALAPVPAISAEYYLHPNVGLMGAAEYAVGLKSENPRGDRLSTKYMAYFAGVRGRYLLSVGELGVHVGYGSQSFEVTKDPAVVDAEVAGVKYNHVRGGASTRVSLSSSLALIAGGSYLHLLDTGEIGEMFPGIKGKGGEGFAGVAVALPWQTGLEARAMLDFRRYVFTMNSIDDDTYIAGGATDQYIGATVKLAFRQ
jgi:hypothetical protein